MAPSVKRLRGMKVPVISLVDCKRQRSTLIISQPPTAKLFNNSYLSDITIKIGDSSFYSHKLVLSAASEVFAKMFHPDWAEGLSSELVLQEDPEAEKIFDKFLKYLYCGKILVQREMLFTLYLLADKYNVESLYTDCVTNIEKGLSVRSEMKDMGSENNEGHDPECTRDCCRSPSVEIGVTRQLHVERGASNEPPSINIRIMAKVLVPNVTFPISTVIKILKVVNNSRIYDAALYNLETRLADQILSENYRIWNNLQPELLMSILSDNHFFCKEFIIYKAVKTWLQSNEDIITDGTVSEILARIRFGVMSASELYDVESDLFLVRYPDTVSSVREAIRFKLFKDCPRALERENWSGEQFTPRTSKPNEDLKKQ